MIIREHERQVQYNFPLIVTRTVPISLNDYHSEGRKVVGIRAQDAAGIAA